MERRGFQLSIAMMTGVVACIAFNLWLFRMSTLLGLVGLNVTKHVVIAWLCQVVGVDKRRARRVPAASAMPAPTLPLR